MKAAWTVLGVLVFALSLGACRSKKQEAGSASKATESGVPIAQASSPPPPPEPEPPELPTESDYEQEASERITGSNLEQELEKLEKELRKP